MRVEVAWSRKKSQVGSSTQILSGQPLVKASANYRSSPAISCVSVDAPSGEVLYIMVVSPKMGLRVDFGIVICFRRPYCDQSADSYAAVRDGQSPQIWPGSKRSGTKPVRRAYRLRIAMPSGPPAPTPVLVLMYKLTRAGALFYRKHR